MLGGRIGRNQLRKLRFQFFQLPGQGIILKILQFGGILVVIKAVVIFDHPAQLKNALLGLFQCQNDHLLKVQL